MKRKSLLMMDLVLEKQVPKRSCKASCGRLRQSGCKGFCITCAKERGISRTVKRKISYCKEPGCKKYKVANFHGYCIGCARKHGIQKESEKDCKTSGCEKNRRGGFSGFCITCARRNGVTKKSWRKVLCKEPGCPKYKAGNHLGGRYCVKHAKEHGFVVRRCKEEGCQRWESKKGQGYCYTCAKQKGFAI